MKHGAGHDICTANHVSDNVRQVAEAMAEESGYHDVSKEEGARKRTKARRRERERGGGR